MWFIIFFLQSFAFANTFESSEGSSKFLLRIDQEAVTYRSPRLNKKVKVSSCNRASARLINQHLFSSTSASPSTDNIKIQIDGRPFRLQTPPAIFIADLDQRIIALEVFTNSYCR